MRRKTPTECVTDTDMRFFFVRSFHSLHFVCSTQVKREKQPAIKMKEQVSDEWYFNNK